MNSMMKQAKKKALGDLIRKMRKMEGMPYSGEEKPDLEDREEMAEDVVGDSDMVMNEDNNEGSEDVDDGMDDFQEEKRSFMKKGHNNAPKGGKGKFIISIGMNKSKMKKSA